jgi:ABC-type antimicrobial peptide transport system permease subunit
MENQQAEQRNPRRRRSARDVLDDQFAASGPVPAYAKEHTLQSDIRLGAFYTWSDVRKRPRNTVIGFAATVTVMLVTGLILLGMGKSRVIFLRFAELTTGEMDALILAEGSVPFVNYTALEPKLARSARTEGTAPRWLVKGELSQVYDRATAGGNAPPTTVTNVLAIDSALEKQIGIGRAYHYREIGYSEMQALESILRFINVPANIGQRALLYIDIAGVLQQQNIQLGQLNGQQINQTNVTDNMDFARQFAEANPTLIIPGLGNVSTAALFGPNFDTVNNATDLLNALIAFNNGASNAALSDFLSPQTKFTVADGISGPLGKYPGTLGNMVIFDYRPFVGMFLEQTCYESIRSPFAFVAGDSAPTIAALPPLATLQQTLNMKDYVLVVVAMMKDRFTVYYKSTRDRTKDMILWSNDLFYAVGIDFGGTAQYPVAAAMVGFDNFALFLNSIFTVSTVVIIALGALLVYTLLLTNSEERGFEVAMLRAQGMTKRQLVALMVSQTCAFVVPGIIVGIALLLSLNAIIEVALTLYTFAPAKTARIATEAVVVPIVCAVLIPILGNAGPIRAAMSQSLRDALDVYRNKANETTVVATRLAELGMDPMVVMLAWLLVIVGFLVYYMVPLAFIFNELWLFFLVMNIILIMMLFGLCLLTGTLQVFLERGILWLLLWGNEKRLKTLIHKNFKSHSERNSKAFMMFNLSVACIVFGGVLFTLLSTSIAQTVSVLTGADVTVTSLQFKTPLNRSKLDLFFQQNGGSVAAWSYETFDLFSYPQILEATILRNSIGFPASQQNFVALEEDFLNAAFGQFCLIEEKVDSYPYHRSATGAIDIVRNLYEYPAARTLRPAGPIFTGFPPNETVPNVGVKYSLVMPSISSSAATDAIGLTAGSYGTIFFKYEIGHGSGKRTIETVYLTSTRALVRKFPGTLAISPLPFSFRSAPTFVTVNDFAVLLRSNQIDFPTKLSDPGYEYNSDKATMEVFYRKVYVRLQPSLEGDAREFFVNLLQSQVDPYYHITADTESVIRSVDVAGQMIIIFFYCVSVIAIILDTLMLWLTFVSNVQLNSWSFAVLRSLGFTVNQLTRAFMYESLSLVFSGFIVGTLIGVAVAMTLVLQLNLFLQLPFQFAFPYGLFFFLFGLSIVSAIIASVIPARQISARPIASVLKGG